MKFDVLVVTASNEAQARGVKVIGPDDGELACGTAGRGRMMDPVRIFEELK